MSLDVSWFFAQLPNLNRIFAKLWKKFQVTLHLHLDLRQNLRHLRPHIAMSQSLQSSCAQHRGGLDALAAEGLLLGTETHGVGGVSHVFPMKYKGSSTCSLKHFKLMASLGYVDMVWFGQRDQASSKNHQISGQLTSILSVHVTKMKPCNSPKTCGKHDERMVLFPFCCFSQLTIKHIQVQENWAWKIWHAPVRRKDAHIQ